MPEENEPEKYYDKNNSGILFTINGNGKGFSFNIINKENKLLAECGPFSSFEKATRFAIRWIDKTVWKIKP